MICGREIKGKRRRESTDRERRGGQKEGNNRRQDGVDGGVQGGGIFNMFKSGPAHQTTPSQLIRAKKIQKKVEQSQSQICCIKKRIWCVQHTEMRTELSKFSFLRKSFPHERFFL